MSRELASGSVASVSLSKSRKQVTKVLSTGQKIALTPQDERTLKTIYDYLSGYSKRMMVESLVEIKKREVEQLKSEIPPGAKLLMKERANALYGTNNFPSGNDDSIKKESDPEKADGEKKVDDYYKAREQLLKAEERLKTYMSVDHKIGFKDLDAVVRSLGKVLHKRQIDVSKTLVTVSSYGLWYFYLRNNPVYVPSFFFSK